jgi:hypothetical protein
VFAWRSAGGSATSVLSREEFSRAIAPSAWLAFWVSAESWSRRSAIAPSALDPATKNCEKVRWSRVSSSRSRLPADRLGAKYL